MYSRCILSFICLCSASAFFERASFHTTCVLSQSTCDNGERKGLKLKHIQFMPHVLQIAFAIQAEETPFTPPLNFIHLDDDMQLQFIDDDIRDHTSLDAKVYAAFESNRDNAPPLAVTILLEVVSTVPELDQNYRDYIAAK